MTRSRGGTRGDTQARVCSGRAEATPGGFEGTKPFARPQTQSGFRPGHKEPLPDILGCPVYRVWLPEVAPSPKEISPSLCLLSSFPTSRPTAASDKSARALGVTGAATGRAPSIIPVPPPPATCAPRGDRHPHRGRSGGPRQRQPCSLEPPTPALCHGHSHNHQRHPGGSWWPAHGSSWGASPAADPGDHRHPQLPRAACQPRDPRVTPLSPQPLVPGAQGEEQPSLSLSALLGKQTPIKAFGDYSRARSSSSGAREHEKTAQREDFCLQALLGSIALGAAALLCPRVTQRGDRHLPAKFGFAELHRAPAWHLPCHGDIPASPTPGEQGCKSVNILFILSITLLHYSLFNPLLFYY